MDTVVTVHQSGSTGKVGLELTFSGDVATAAEDDEDQN